MPDSPHHEEWRPRHSPWLVAVGVMLATFMQVLDTSIANIALPHIAGSLSATTDQATWVLTSYLVANAIILPMTGWLGNHFGQNGSSSPASESSRSRRSCAAWRRTCPC